MGTLGLRLALLIVALAGSAAAADRLLAQRNAPSTPPLGWVPIVLSAGYAVMQVEEVTITLEDNGAFSISGPGTFSLTQDAALSHHWGRVRIEKRFGAGQPLFLILDEKRVVAVRFEGGGWQHWQGYGTLPPGTPPFLPEGPDSGERARQP